MEEKKYISRKELAKILSLSVKTLQKYQKEGMPHLSLGRPRYNLEEVIEWIKNKKGCKD